MYCRRSRRFLKNEKKNNINNFAHTVWFHPDFTIMKVGGSLLSLIWGGNWAKHPSNSQTLGKTQLQLCGLQLACGPSSLYFASLVMAAYSLIGFGTCTRSLEYWSLWLQICVIFHCMRPMSIFEISFSWKRNKVLLLLLAWNSLKKCCSVCNLMHNFCSAYDLATHILMEKSTDLFACLSICLLVCLFVNLSDGMFVCLPVCPSVKCRTSTQDKTRTLFVPSTDKGHENKTTVLLMKGTSHLENSLKADLL